MAYRDYLHCKNCDCKLLYDGHQSLRESLEETFGNPAAPEYTPLLLCPDCIVTLQSELAAAREEIARAQWALIKEWAGVGRVAYVTKEDGEKAQARYAREIANAHKGEEG
jgi:hypothetical protein